MKNIDKYLNEKIKDKKTVGIVKKMIKQDGIVNLDFEDVKSILDNACETKVFSGVEGDAEKIPHGNYSGALLFMEGPTGMTLDQTKWIAEKVCDKMDEDARLVWAAKINEKVKKIKFQVLFAKSKNEGS